MSMDEHWLRVLSCPLGLDAACSLCIALSSAQGCSPVWSMLAGRPWRAPGLLALSIPLECQTYFKGWGSHSQQLIWWSLHLKDAEEKAKARRRSDLGLRASKCKMCLTRDEKSRRRDDSGGWEKLQKGGSNPAW